MGAKQKYPLVASNIPIISLGRKVINTVENYDMHLNGLNGR
jgi:hypothetical protein